MALMQTLEDQFFGTVIDPKWTLVGGTPTNFIKQQNGQIELSSDGISGNYYTLQSTATYDLTGSFAFVKVVSVGSQAANFDCLPILLQDVGTTNKLWWDVGGNTLAAFKLVAGAQTSILTTPFNATTHKWLRIRESGGTTFWDYTSDPNIGWTNFTSQSNPITVTALEGCIQVGQFGAAAADTLKVDSFNFNNPQMWIGNYQGGQVWRKKRRRYQKRQYFIATPAGIDQQVTPDLATLTLNTFASIVSVSNNQSVTPGLATLTLTTFAGTATVSNNQSVTPGLKTLTLATFAPAVTLGINVIPSTASLTLTAFAGTVSVSNNQSVTPGLLALVLTDFAPSVTASDNKTVTPGVTALTLTSFVPVIGNSIVVIPSTKSLALTTFAPTASPSANQSVTPGTLSLVITLFTPTVIQVIPSVFTPLTTSLSSFTNETIDTGGRSVVTDESRATLETLSSQTNKVSDQGSNDDSTLDGGNNKETLK